MSIYDRKYDKPVFKVKKKKKKKKKKTPTKLGFLGCKTQFSQQRERDRSQNLKTCVKDFKKNK